MRIYKINELKKKAKKLEPLQGEEFMNDHRLLAETWNEKKNTATFTKESVMELNIMWNNKKNQKPCTGCRGL